MRLNVCKSWACPNLGVPDAMDYQQPVYRLGYPALHCARCGSLPPLFNEPLFNGWFSRFLAQKLKQSGTGCPHCASALTIRYGTTQTGRQRLQCRACRKIFTPWQPGDKALRHIQACLAALARGETGGDRACYRTLAQAAAWCEAQLVERAHRAAHIATQTFTVPMQGEHPQQPLYVVLSADIVTGQVLQVTSSYCEWKPHEALRYPGGDAGHPALRLCGALRVREQEAQFMRRRQFDDIRYGYAALCRNDPGALLRPAIVIHGHFQWLRRRFPEVLSHSLAHECVLRGAAITAWAAQVSAGKTQLRFVVEETLNERAAGGAYVHRGSWRIGWWNNLWQQWENGATRKMIGMLTGEDDPGDIPTVSLQACMAFTDWLRLQPGVARWGHHRAGVVSQQLICLAYRYNQQLMAQRTAEPR
ncbi:IS1 family transposase [Cronobacter muytjensii]|uniref:IS1 family transposase n=1 Tax=Cronobacter muytjensii TaxID=413501 RepID=UPI000AD4738F|nr:IS1 family transposase [Cronobacter muytjensii]